MTRRSARRLRGVVAAAVLVWLHFFAGDAEAAVLHATVAAVATPPSLDPAAPLDGWPASPDLPITWDVIHSRPADDGAVVHAASDGRFLYVRFDVTQHGPVVASQHSNDTITGGSQGQNGSLAWGNDDDVWVDLWPTGPTGFAYQFEANANGSHNAASSENTVFSPQWTSRGALTPSGYVVTMAIPLAVIHGAHSGTWRAQFIRYARAAGAQDVWSFEPAQTSADDAARAGSLALTVAAVPLPKPRAAIYALGAVASAPAGGPTSRVGADVSIPVTPTAAVFAALHPDYSNVELDQQTIAPAVAQRQYTEVRPFFTQAASYYTAAFSCDICITGRTLLYTPAIPTFAQGYAFEGKQGDFGAAAFDAIGDGRNDSAATVDYTSADTRWNAEVEHVGAVLPGIVDDANEIGARWSDLRSLSAYANVSTETGTNVSQPGLATAWEVGGGYGSPHTALYAVLRDIGPQFSPVDGYVGHPGIAGYGLYGARIWDFAPNDALASIGVSYLLDRYQGPVYGRSQSDDQLYVDALTRNAWEFQVYTGSSYWRFGETLTPISQNGGFLITYHSGTQTDNANNFPSHGGSAFPTTLQYETGRFGDGRLDTWFRTSTVRVGEKGSLTFTLDSTAQYFPAGIDNVQWFEGVAYGYQVDRASSFAIGVRKVVGDPPVPNGGGNCAGTCTNVSLAYHLRLTNLEFYLAYGNPNTLVTVPQALLKIIYYVGAQKGT